MFEQLFLNNEQRTINDSRSIALVYLIAQFHRRCVQCRSTTLHAPDFLRSLIELFAFEPNGVCVWRESCPTRLTTTLGSNGMILMGRFNQTWINNKTKQNAKQCLCRKLNWKFQVKWSWKTLATVKRECLTRGGRFEIGLAIFRGKLTKVHVGDESDIR